MFLHCSVVILNAYLDFYYSIFIIMDPCSHLVSFVWQPPGTLYTAVASPQSGIYNVTGPLFLRCANNQTSNCQPITGEDISLDFLMQKHTAYPEQVAVHPSDPAGRYYTVMFAVPARPSVGKKGAILFGSSAETIVQRAGCASPSSHWLDVKKSKNIRIELIWFGLIGNQFTRGTQFSLP